MFEFRLKHSLGEGEWVEKEYEVLSFWKESEYFWSFWAKAIRLVYQGKDKDIDESERLYCFPKKKKIGETGNHVPIYEDLDPPGFYNKMRNKAILYGTVKVQGDDAHHWGMRVCCSKKEHGRYKENDLSEVSTDNSKTTPKQHVQNPNKQRVSVNSEESEVFLQGANNKNKKTDTWDNETEEFLKAEIGEI